MLKNTIRKFKEKLGYSLMEMLIVIGVIAVTIGIATPAVSSIRRSLNLTQGNEHAKAIYMAAQNNLTQMRSMGELGMLETASSQTDPLAVRSAAGPSYRYSFSKDDRTTTYDLIVPVTLESGVRNQQVIVEYHPKAGIVYSVFYYEGNKNLEDLYRDDDDNALIRGLRGTEKERKKMGVGYYCVGDVDALEDQAFKVYYTSAAVSYENGQKGMLVVDVPIVDKKGDNMFSSPDYGHYKSCLEIVLTVTGENGGEYTETITQESTKAKFTPKNAQNLLSVEILMDGLDPNESYASNALNQPDGGSGNLIAPGDNVSVTAEVTFYPSRENDPLIVVESTTIAGINPMFHSLTQNPDHNEAVVNSPKPYILAVSNGRHLQNLSVLDNVFANQIEAIVFTQPEAGQGIALAADDLVLDWAETADAYEFHKNLVPIDLSKLENVPTIDGNGVEIRNLTINSAVEMTEDSVKVQRTGLFAKLKDTNIKNITLVNPTVHATTATATGALAGSTENATITNCNITNAPAAENGTMISGKTDVGGLIGYADKSKFADCTTGAIVLGTGIGNSNLGGLVGTSKASEFTNCEAISVSVTSAERSGDEDTKNALGGLVGSAISEGATKSTFSDCSADSDTRITSAAYSFSDLGGFVGYTSGAAFTRCDSSALATGTAPKEGNDIPNNNLGGFVGQSVLSDYSDITVTLNYLPQYAADAGGFAGLLYGGELSDLDMTFAENARGQATVTHFGGIAGICAKKLSVTDVSVKARARLDNATEHIGGAFAIIGESGEKDISNVRVELDIGLGSAQVERAGGFASVAGAGSNIRNSYVLGSVTGKMAAGFVYDNARLIEGCFANVTMSSGAAFTASNNGTIKNCYGWVWNHTSSDAIDAIKITKGCTYSYFVNGTAARTDGSAMVLYEGTAGVPSEAITDTAALQDSWALELLNKGATQNADGTLNAAWTSGNSVDYPYPILKTRAHLGDWAAAAVGAAYPYRLMYEETYSDNSTGKLLIIYDGDSKTIKSNTLSDTLEIKDTAYYLCHRTLGGLGTEVAHRDNDNFSSWMEKFEMDVNELYTIYSLNKRSVYKDGKINTYYPYADSDGYFWIRTADQFSNISDNSSKSFRIKRNISVGSDETISDFSGNLTAANGVTVTATAPLIGNLSGAVSGLNIAAKISNVENAGAIAKTMSGGSISNCSVSGIVSGSGNVGGVVGTVSGGTISGVTTSAQVSDGINTGTFVGYASGGTFDNCVSTVASGLPFGCFAATELTDANYSWTNSLNGSDLLYAVNFKNFNAVQNVPHAVHATVNENCKITNSTGTQEKAMNGYGLYYYAVDTDDVGYQNASGIQIIALVDAGVRYNDLLNSTQTSYYAPYNNTYYRMNLEVTPNMNGEDIESYTFKFTSVLEEFTKSVTVTDLSTAVSENLPLYEISCATLDSTDEYYYQLKANGGYLVWNGTNVVISSMPEDTKSGLWFKNGDSWYNCKANTVAVAVTHVDLSIASFTSLATISSESLAGASITTNDVYAQGVSLYYGYTPLGSALEVNDPS